MFSLANTCRMVALQKHQNTRVNHPKKHKHTQTSQNLKFIAFTGEISFSFSFIHLQHLHNLPPSKSQALPQPGQPSSAPPSEPLPAEDLIQRQISLSSGVASAPVTRQLSPEEEQSSPACGSSLEECNKVRAELCRFASGVGVVQGGYVREFWWTIGDIWMFGDGQR